MNTDEQRPRALTVDAFCQAYAIGRTMAYEEIAAGRLRIRKIGSRTLILCKDADEWAEALPSPAGQLKKA